VSTPIGNLRDITLRALDVLAAADVVFAEDTRVTSRLLSAHGVRTPPGGLRSCNAHSEAGRVRDVVAAVAAGQQVVLVSDAGTPCISDPGHALVAAVRAAGLRVAAVPGACAAVAAICVTGLPITAAAGLAAGSAAAASGRRGSPFLAAPAPPDGAARPAAGSMSACGDEGQSGYATGFVFLGFLPREGKVRRSALRSVVAGGGGGDAWAWGRGLATVFYEAPTRVADTLADLAATAAALAAGTTSSSGDARPTAEDASNGAARKRRRGGGGRSEGQAQPLASAGLSAQQCTLDARSVWLCRELTKMHEEAAHYPSLSAAAAALAAGGPCRGEYCVVVAPPGMVVSQG
jgi:16S rRNA (cytidine1402-2'-O)-methyltransferase